VHFWHSTPENSTKTFSFSGFTVSEMSLGPQLAFDGLENGVRSSANLWPKDRNGRLNIPYEIDTTGKHLLYYFEVANNSTCLITDVPASVFIYIQVISELD